MSNTRIGLDGGPAFPETDYYDEKPTGSRGGMSLRDYFAGQALPEVICDTFATTNETIRPAAVATMAYAIADAMLKEREK